MPDVAALRRVAWREMATCFGAIRKASTAQLRERFYSRIGNNSRCETYALRCKSVEAGLVAVRQVPTNSQ